MPSNRLFYRMQDSDGRGPFKPGFSRYWIDPARTDWPLPWYEEWPDLYRRLPCAGHVGCGCATLDGLLRWFNERERPVLYAAGYRVVVIDVDRILAESEHQAVFWRRRPLRFGTSQVALGAAQKDSA